MGLGWDFHFGVARAGFMVGYQHADSKPAGNLQKKS